MPSFIVSMAGLPATSACVGVGPSLLARRGLEDSVKRLRGNNIGRARSKTHYAGFTTEAKDVEVARGDILSPVCEDLSCLGRCTA